MSNHESVRWGWICKVVAAVIIAYAIFMGISGSVSETRANLANIGGVK